MPACKKKVPQSMLVRELKTLCSRLYKFPMEHIRLVAVESGCFTGFELTQEERELSFWGLACGVEGEAGARSAWQTRGVYCPTGAAHGVRAALVAETPSSNSARAADAALDRTAGRRRWSS